ncbi:SIS domain-containing protein [Streptomyces sp. IBSNAI002]|uniref:SIS domain-containing protein n=1 Tax=Streptomyces sp. IBSNAI002 TaxID=3457500 RepID=UPI003FD0A03D
MPVMERPGSIMIGEIGQQPEVWRRLLADGAGPIAETARAIAARGPRFVLLAARGSSDHAALYAKYLLEVGHGLPCGLSSMSTITAYGATPRLEDVLVVTVSQSGGSPDLVASALAARRAGALTLAVTNNPDSGLAAVSEYRIDVLAGPEKALPATKTYTASLLALYLFAAALREADGSAAAAALPGLAAGVLARGEEVRALAARYRFAERMVVTSRGFGYPTAREAAFKLMETSYIAAFASSGADLLHGPLALVDNVSPVIAVVPDGRAGEALQPVLDRLRSRGADLCVVGSKERAEAAATGFALPADGVPEELWPLLEILPLQLLAHEIAVARGHDPDAPRALAKVTETS